MALVLKDRVRETTTVLGTNDATLLGAVTGFQSFSVVGSGNTCYYTISDQSGGNWEVGIGTYSSVGPTLARTTILASSNSGSIVAFPAGTKDVFLTYPSERAVYLDASGNLTITGGLSVNGNTTLGDASSDTITFTAQAASNLVPSANNTYDLGSATNAWKDLYVNGSTYIVGGTANGVMYLNSSKIVTTGSVLTFDGTTFTSGAHTLSTGNLNFGGTAQRITGDFSNATDANRVAFQTSTTNGGTRVNIISNGTGTASSLDVFGLSDPTNASVTRIRQSGTESQIQATITGTGTYLPMTFYTNGSEQMRLTSTGLGIGTSSPSYKVDVSSATVDDATAGVRIRRGGVSTDWSLIDNVTGSMNIRQYDSTTPIIRFLNSTDGTTWVERMRIDSSGNLGLGVTPSAWGSGFKALQIGSGLSPSISYVDGFDATTNAYYDGTNWKYTLSGYAAGKYAQVTNTTSSSHVWYNAPSGTAGNAITFTQAMTLDASGNLGIGTSSPSQRLSLNGSSVSMDLTVTGASDTSNIYFRDNASAIQGYIRYDNGSEYLSFATNGASERMRIDSSGNVGIGTSSVTSGAKLQVTGSDDTYVFVKSDGAGDYSLSLGSGGTPLIARGAGAPLAFGTVTNNSVITSWTEQMRIDSSGNVGIGTSSPITKLDVVGSINFGPSDGSCVAVGVTNTFTPSGGNPTAYYGMTFGGFVTNSLSLSGYNGLAFYTNAGFERMRIDSSGNVGIGITSYSRRLSSQYDSATTWSTSDFDSAPNQLFLKNADTTINAFTGIQFNVGGNGDAAISAIRTADGESALAFGTRGGGSRSERMRIDSSGNVGIGTSSPSSITGGKCLTVYGNGTFATISVQAVEGGNDRNATLELLSSGNGGSYSQILYGDTDATPVTKSPLVFAEYYSGVRTERMRIDSSGNLLVGTTTSSAKFSIDGVGGSNGQTLFANGWGSGIGAFATLKAANTSNADVIYFETSAAQVGKIAITSTSTSYVTSSDYRLKENVQPMQNALDTVAQLNPVTYTWKVDGSDGQGFIAHELQAVVPDCVTGEKDAVDADGNPVYQGIDTSFLVATLTKAIQEQQQLIEALTARVAQLEGK